MKNFNIKRVLAVVFAVVSLIILFFILRLFRPNYKLGNSQVVADLTFRYPYLQNLSGPVSAQTSRTLLATSVKELGKFELLLMIDELIRAGYLTASTFNQSSVIVRRGITEAEEGIIISNYVSARVINDVGPSDWQSYEYVVDFFYNKSTGEIYVISSN